MNLKVDNSTLIPRPETEELVDIIVHENQSHKDLNILDIGTGSGAITIALSRNLPFSNVDAIDISENALKIANENARNLHTHIGFTKADIFKFEPKTDYYDIIVSNPPYIDESEKDSMDSNVLEYEPHQALFVPDENPLIYYIRITETAKDSLKQRGHLYFEINPRHAEELAEYLNKKGYMDIEIVKDINGKKRFIKCVKQ